MRKRCTPFIVLMLLWSIVGQGIAQIYQVQIAAFTEPIDRSYFDFAGYPKVYADQDYNNFTRYTVGEFFTQEQANAQCEKAQKNGFSNAYVVKLDQPMFAYAGDGPELPLMTVPEKENLFIRSVKFKGAELSLNNDLMVALEEALLVLRQQPDLRLRIVGHTDDIGEHVVNQTISKKRARIIQNFLLANGIPAYRLKMKVSEHPSPTVYFKGKGIPKTRDYNRRIILTMVNLKEEIVVDNFQQKDKKNQSLLSVVKKTVQLAKFVKLA